MTKILLVDDNQLISNMLMAALSEQGYEVEAAFDANQGYATAVTFHPDLMLIDVQLPDVIGFDLVKIIKNHPELQQVPIIMITGTAHKPEEKVRGFQLGIDDYVLKPFEMTELLERIKAVLRRSQNARIPVQPASPVAVEPVPAPAPLSIPAPAITPKPTPILPTKSTVAAPAPAALTLLELLEKILLEPEMAYKALGPSRLVLAYWLTSLGLTLLSVLLTAGMPMKPIIAALWVSGTWGLAIATTVMSCSIMGLHLTWQEGGKFISYAGVPLLFKIIGGLFISILTGLSAFYFTASPAMFVPGCPWLLQRIDLFEIWSCILLWHFIRYRAGGIKKYSWVTVSLVWIVCAGMTILLSKLQQPVNL